MKKKLQLSKETLRDLTNIETKQAAGGVPRSAFGDCGDGGTAASDCYSNAANGGCRTWERYGCCY